jgi:hypothetical protein
MNFIYYVTSDIQPNHPENNYSLYVIVWEVCIPPQSLIVYMELRVFILGFMVKLFFFFFGGDFVEYIGIPL